MEHLIRNAWVSAWPYLQQTNCNPLLYSIVKAYWRLATTYEYKQQQNGELSTKNYARKDNSWVPHIGPCIQLMTMTYHCDRLCGY